MKLIVFIFLFILTGTANGQHARQDILYSGGVSISQERHWEH